VHELSINTFNITDREAAHTNTPDLMNNILFSSQAEAFSEFTNSITSTDMADDSTYTGVSNSQAHT